MCEWAFLVTIALRTVISIMVGRGGLEPPTSALIGHERCAYESGRPHGKCGVLCGVVGGPHGLEPSDQRLSSKPSRAFRRSPSSDLQKNGVRKRAHWRPERSMIA